MQPSKKLHKGDLDVLTSFVWFRKIPIYLVHRVNDHLKNLMNRKDGGVMI